MSYHNTCKKRWQRLRAFAKAFVFFFSKRLLARNCQRDQHGVCINPNAQPPPKTRKSSQRASQPHSQPRRITCPQPNGALSAPFGRPAYVSIWRSARFLLPHVCRAGNRTRACFLLRADFSIFFIYARPIPREHCADRSSHHLHRPSPSPTRTHCSRLSTRAEPAGEAILQALSHFADQLAAQSAAQSADQMSALLAIVQRFETLHPVPSPSHQSHINQSTTAPHPPTSSVSPTS